MKVCTLTCQHTGHEITVVLKQVASVILMHSHSRIKIRLKHTEYAHEVIYTSQELMVADHAMLIRSLQECEE